jgi:hypothetical protein
VTAPLVVALFHERERAAAPRVGYKLWHLARAWEARGLGFEAAFGVPERPRGDLWVNHLDLTCVPERHARFLAERPRVANRRALDLSKRAVSANLLARGDVWAGPVIVKTDWNHGAVPERRAFGRRGHVDDPRRRRGALLRGLVRAGGVVGELRRRGCLDPAGYAVFGSLAEVPAAAWEEPDLVVERLLLERDGEHYCGRCHLFLGDRSLSLRKWGTAPVLRARSVTRMEPIEDDPAMVAARRRLGLDYGKLDYVVVGGEAVLLDASRTPTFALADAPLPPFDRRMVETLAEGIDALLEGAATGRP